VKITDMNGTVSLNCADVLLRIYSLTVDKHCYVLSVLNGDKV